MILICLLRLLGLCLVCCVDNVRPESRSLDPFYISSWTLYRIHHISKFAPTLIINNSMTLGM